MNYYSRNKKAVAILRVSSKKQGDGESHETQESYIKQYCKDKGLDLISIEPIIESAKESSNRTKYNSARKKAIELDASNLVFFMIDRETRNFTDAEYNEAQVRQGLITLHYAHDGVIIHKDSPATDFLMRDFQTFKNKYFSIDLSTKVKASQKYKAENGWIPINKPALGYVHQKLRDEFGKELKRGTTIVPDPDKRNVRLVQREYELRAQGYPLDEIRKQILSEGIVPPKRVKSYYKSGIEKRLKNKFYRGLFDWGGTEYQGKHELIIPKHILDAVDASFGHKAKYMKRVKAGEGIFAGGWLTCGNPECGCHIIYDPKTKKIKQTGESKTYHYYHCTNGKKAHKTLKGMTISEEKIWSQFGKSIDSINLPETWAEQIAEALNKTHHKVLDTRKKEIEGYRLALKGLEGQEDILYDDLKSGVLDEKQYKRRIEFVRTEREHLTFELEKVNKNIDDAYLHTAKSILELATKAKSLWESRSPLERRMFLEKLLSNPVLDGLSISFDWKKPFGVIAQMTRNGKWRPQGDLNPCYRRERAMSWTRLDDGDAIF